MVFPVFLERGEILFDWIEVRRVRRQEQQRGAGCLDELRRRRRFVKGCVVHDHEMLGRQAGTQPRLQPGVEDDRIAGPFEQKRFFELPVHPGRNQRGAWSPMPGDEAVHALALGGVPIAPCRRRRKATFIDMDRLFAVTKKPLAPAQELSALARVTFLVPNPFFYGSSAVVAARTRYNVARPGNGVPAPLVSDQDGPPHDGASVPSPACGIGEGLGVCRPRRQA